MTRLVLGVVLITAGAAWVLTARASERMPDFEVYWRAGAREG